jgi:hypothetical protein
MTVTITIHGLDEAITALKALEARVDRGTADAAYAGGHAIQHQARANLGRRSHERGTPTPSPRGEPPARIDGTLWRSVSVGLPVPRGTAHWVCEVSSDLPYSRIQEIGGWAGRGLHSYLPPRPYLAPAVATAVASGLIKSTFEKAWAKALSA